MNDPIKIAIADDHTLFRQALKSSLVSTNDNFRVVIDASNGSELLKTISDYKVDVLLLDLYMPHLTDGFETLKEVKKYFPDIRVLIISMSSDESILGKLLELGIYGFISKFDAYEDLPKAIVSAYNHKIFHNNFYTNSLYANQIHLLANRSSKVGFSERERHILNLLLEEKSNEEIASEIFLSVRSVEKIRQDMKNKVGAKNVIGLLKYAINNRII
jgi:DNA-binding NarL/FixJ family response regulator